MRRVAVFISGRGSNLQSLIDACTRKEFPCEIGVVISNRPGARGLERARRAGLERRVVDHTLFENRGSFEAELDAIANRAGCTLICLAGFMRILTPGFVNRWHDRILNIHPTLLPAFPGLDCHRRAIEEGVKISGCTVHFVRPELDHGPIVAQAAVPVLPGDDEESLAARVLEAEHRIYPLALDLVVRNRIRVVDGRVELDADGEPAPLHRILMNPAG